MKILLIYLPEASPELLFGGEGMETMPYLVSIGSYGFLSKENSISPEWMTVASLENADGQHELLTIWDFLKEAEKSCLSFGSPPQDWKNAFDNAEDDTVKLGEGISQLTPILENQPWDFCQILDDTFTHANDSLAPYLTFDQGLKDLLGGVDESTLILVQPRQPGVQEGSFVLVSPNNPIAGEFEGGSLIDVAPTILELAGYPLPENIQGRSWVAGMDLQDSIDSGLSAEEEEILRERLSGLGYL